MTERFAFAETFPAALLERYIPLELLSENDLGQTFLLQKKDGGDFVVARLCESNNARAEARILSRLSCEGIPKLLDKIETDDRIYLIREYMPGVPLSEYAAKPLSEERAVHIALSLCELLSYIHSQTPPVIHRDLKPSNILIDLGTGKVSLIDFGIARSFSAGASDDTVLAGTHRFAPPEQYGFGQTDARTDIYALGIVLCWLLSGKTSVQELRSSNRRLGRVIRKCATFAPKNRYRSAQALRRALSNVDGKKQRRLLRAIAFALALLVVGTGGFALGRFTDVRPAIFYGTPYAIFSEPLVEQAVRLQLGKAEGEPILKEELESITELYIYADQIAETQMELDQMRGQVDRGEIAAEDGTISTLDDILQLGNLQRLSLGNQQITDISALEALGGLTSLEIFNCPIESIAVVGTLSKLQHFTMDNCSGITDISPLAGCTELRELVMTNCKAEDFSVLAELGDIEFLHLQCVDPAKFLPYLQGKTVRQLKIGSAELSSFSDLSGIIGLEDLIIDYMDIPSLEGAQTLTDLKYLTLLSVSQTDLSPLLNLPSLETLTLSEDLREAAQSIEDKANFSISYQ